MSGRTISVKQRMSPKVIIITIIIMIIIINIVTLVRMMMTLTMIIMITKQAKIKDKETSLTVLTNVTFSYDVSFIKRVSKGLNVSRKTAKKKPLGVKIDKF